jgi:FAD/FMN-containing dehydrogenase
MNHNDKVQRIVEQVKIYSAAEKRIKLKKSAISHFVPNPYDKSAKLPRVDLSDLDEVLLIDPRREICVAEPGVTYEKLVKATMQYNLIPQTVPELKTITVGGAVSGCSIESMSYKYGGFHDSCLEYEIVSGEGEVITCSPENNADTFHMIHGSYGTLGIISKLTFKLVPAKPYVRMKYVSFDNFDSYWSYMKERCEVRDYDFIDGIIHSKNQFVVCLGDMVDEVPYVSDYTWLNIYYKSTSRKTEDYLKLSDYFFRYDTECHWLTKTVPLMETKPVRFALGKLVLGSTNLIKWSNRLKSIMRVKKRPDVVVDVFIPGKRFREFISWYENEYDFYPLWIVPYRVGSVYPWINDEYAKGMADDILIDCAVYGKRNNKPDIDYSETLEKKTIELNGIKTLISRNHFDEKTFWSVYNKRNYSDVKRNMDPKNLFNDLYSKFSPATYR